MYNKKLCGYKKPCFSQVFKSWYTYLDSRKGQQNLPLPSANAVKIIRRWRDTGQRKLLKTIMTYLNQAFVSCRNFVRNLKYPAKSEPPTCF